MRTEYREENFTLKFNSFRSYTKGIKKEVTGVKNKVSKNKEATFAYF